MTDKEKINILYSDIKNINIPSDLTNEDLQNMANEIKEGLGIILNHIKVVAERWKK